MSTGAPPIRDRAFLQLVEELKHVRVYDGIGNPGVDMTNEMDAYIRSENFRDGFINTDEFLELIEKSHRLAASIIAKYRAAHPNGNVG